MRIANIYLQNIVSNLKTIICYRYVLLITQSVPKLYELVKTDSKPKGRDKNYTFVSV